MRQFFPDQTAREAWLALSVSALMGAVSAGLVAVHHMQQMGVICGGGPAPHCAACYIAPAFLALALAAFVKSRRPATPVMIGHDRRTESLRLARHGGRSAL